MVIFLTDDHSRVILRKNAGSDSDYINANYIDVSLLHFFGHQLQGCINELRSMYKEIIRKKY